MSSHSHELGYPWNAMMIAMIRSASRAPTKNVLLMQRLASFPMLSYIQILIYNNSDDTL
jgi:hypothetical protein